MSAARENNSLSQGLPAKYTQRRPIPGQPEPGFVEKCRRHLRRTAFISLPRCVDVNPAKAMGIPDDMSRRHPSPGTGRRGGRPPFDCIALLLQGGGALGAYQAGVYEALAEADLHPDWVAGISIGAINAAIIAGNPPERSGSPSCTQFWEGITAGPRLGLGWKLDPASCGHTGRRRASDCSTRSSAASRP